MRHGTSHDESASFGVDLRKDTQSSDERETAHITLPQHFEGHRATTNGSQKPLRP